MKKIFLTLVIFIALFGSFFSFNIQTASAQDSLIVCATPPECSLDDLIATVNKIINFLVVIAASVVAMMFCYAGFIYLTAGGDTGKAKKAKEVFTSTAIGFVLILSGWLIIKFVLQGFEADKEFLDVLKDK